MTLSDIEPNQTCKLLSIDQSCGSELHDFFYKFGLFPGVDIKVLHKRKVPMQIKIGIGNVFYLRRDEAKQIRVENAH